MTALLVSRVKVRDADKMKAYAAAAAPTLSAAGAEVVLRGNFAGALVGSGVPHVTGIMRFPSVSAVNDWFASADYQALVPLRDAAGDAEFFVYEAP